MRRLFHFILVLVKYLFLATSKLWLLYSATYVPAHYSTQRPRPRPPTAGPAPAAPRLRLFHPPRRSHHPPRPPPPSLPLSPQPTYPPSPSASSPTSKSATISSTYLPSLTIRLAPHLQVCHYLLNLTTLSHHTVQSELPDFWFSFRVCLGFV
jgi:hypothetical protein